MSDELPPLEQVLPAVEHAMGLLDAQAGLIQGFADRLSQSAGAVLDKQAGDVKSLKSRLNKAAGWWVRKQNGPPLTEMGQRMRSAAAEAVDSNQRSVESLMQRMPALPSTTGEERVGTALVRGPVATPWRPSPPPPLPSQQEEQLLPCEATPEERWQNRGWYCGCVGRSGDLQCNHVPGDDLWLHGPCDGCPHGPPPECGNFGGRAVALCVNPVLWGWQFPSGQWARCRPGCGLDLPIPPPVVPPTLPPVVPPTLPPVPTLPPTVPASAQACAQLPEGIPSVAVYVVPWLDPGDDRPSTYSECGRKLIDDAAADLDSAAEFVAALASPTWVSDYLGDLKIADTPPLPIEPYTIDSEGV